MQLFKPEFLPLSLPARLRRPLISGQKPSVQPPASIRVNGFCLKLLPL